MKSFRITLYDSAPLAVLCIAIFTLCACGFAITQALRGSL